MLYHDDVEASVSFTCVETDKQKWFSKIQGASSVLFYHRLAKRTLFLGFITRKPKVLSGLLSGANSRQGTCLEVNACVRDYPP